jgi:26S proteasome regulatory subunit (ATPase 3-interacting protein)
VAVPGLVDDEDIVLALPPLSALVSSASADITTGPDVPTEGAAKKLILKYLRQQNRPYSAMQIFDNLHHRVLKGRVESVCEALAADQSSGVLVKEYGKAKLYFPNQYMLGNLPTNIESLKAENAQATRRLRDLQAQEKSLHDAVEALARQPSDHALDSVLATQEVACATLSAQADRLGGANIAQDACENAVKRFNFYRSKWSQRRTAVMDMVENIADGMEKKVAIVVDQLGVVTDAEAMHGIPDMMVQKK